MAVEILRTPEELEALGSEWRALYEQSQPRNPFLSFEWTSACWDRRRGRAAPFIATARQGGRLVGVAPLCLFRSGPFRVLKFIGDGNSDYLGVLRAADCPAATTSLITALSEARDAWDLAVLRRVCDAYSDPLRSSPDGLALVSVEGPVAPYLPLSCDWKTLVRSGPSQLRHCQRWVRKFEREGGVVERCSGPAALSLMDEIVAIDIASWKGRNRTAWFDSDDSVRFLKTALMSIESLEVWMARIDGTAIAFLVNFTTDQRVLFYKGSYREDSRKYYPGGVLHSHAIRDACERGLLQYDFLIGSENYKDGWTTAAHSQEYVALFPKGLRGRLAFASLLGARWYLRKFDAAHGLYGFLKRVPVTVGALARPGGG